MKKKIALLSVVLVVAISLAACNPLKMVTGRVLEDYLENPNDGPQKSIDVAMDGILEDIAINEYTTAGIEDYTWRRENTSIRANVGDPPGGISGILTAKDIVLTYEYTLVGEPLNDDLDKIEKSGTLRFDIDKLRYDESRDALVELTPDFAESGDDSPEMANLEVTTDPVSISASINNILDNNPKTVAYIAGDTYPMNIIDNKASLELNNSISSDGIGAILSFNRSVLADPNNSETGFSAGIFGLIP